MLSQNKGLFLKILPLQLMNPTKDRNQPFNSALCTLRLLFYVHREQLCSNGKKPQRHKCFDYVVNKVEHSVAKEPVISLCSL